MAAIKATPGPWGCVYTSNHAHDYRLTMPNGQPMPVRAVANDHSEQRANARLIAAAPELRDALRAALFFVPLGTNARVNADAILDKIDGFASPDAGSH